MKIAIGSDHAGFSLKENIGEFVKSLGHEITDLGCDCAGKSVDYPDYALAVAEGVSEKRFDTGILVCGSGQGMAIAANKVRGIRATPCFDTLSARFSRSHNNANILVMGERLTTPAVAREITKIWLETPFEGGRHQMRLDKIAEYEKKMA